MTVTEILVLRLEPDYHSRSLTPDKTVFFDDTVASLLGFHHSAQSSNSFTLAVGHRQMQMLAVVLPLNATAHTVRLTRKALQTFHLKNGHRYWMEWTASTRELRVFS